MFALKTLVFVTNNKTPIKTNFSLVKKTLGKAEKKQTANTTPSKTKKMHTYNNKIKKA